MWDDLLENANNFEIPVPKFQLEEPNSAIPNISFVDKEFNKLLRQLNTVSEILDGMTEVLELKMKQYTISDFETTADISFNSDIWMF